MGTYSDLFQCGILIVGIIGLCLAARKDDMGHDRPFPPGVVC